MIKINSPDEVAYNILANYNYALQSASTLDADFKNKTLYINNYKLTKRAQKQLLNILGLPSSLVITKRGKSEILAHIENNKFTEVKFLRRASQIFSIFVGDWGWLNSHLFIDPILPIKFLSAIIHKTEGNIKYIYDNKVEVNQSIFRDFKPYLVFKKEKVFINIQSLALIKGTLFSYL